MRLVRLAAATFAAIACAQAASARQPAPIRNLECRDIRRLSDNYLLDLRIRMAFSPARGTYLRLENTGRGWQVVGERPYVAIEPTRIVLVDEPVAKAYIDRLTGDYYQVDATSMGLSVWGRCALVGGLNRLF